MHAVVARVLSVVSAVFGSELDFHLNVIGEIPSKTAAAVVSKFLCDNSIVEKT